MPEETTIWSKTAAEEAAGGPPGENPAACMRETWPEPLPSSGGGSGTNRRTYVRPEEIRRFINQL